jgi:molybdopterin-guanine dinucleotide biosynthesis protein A
MNNIKAAIIAGGKAKRLGGITKAKIEITGKTILERQLKVLASVFDQTVTICSKPIDNNLINFEDIYKDSGPLEEFTLH